MQVVTIFGSNAGDKQRFITEGIRLLSVTGEVVKLSSYYETEPWGFESKENFLNQVVVFDTVLTPYEFLRHCLDTEKILGRVRSTEGARYASRPIDIDILFYDSLILDTLELTIPHPRIAERNFVLTPLCEIIPEFVHPIFHKTVAELLKACGDRLATKKINACDAE